MMTSPGVTFGVIVGPMPTTRRARPANEFALFLTARMDEVGLSPNALAEMLGISRATVYRWRDADRPLATQRDSSEIIPALARLLRVRESVLANKWRGTASPGKVAPIDERERVLGEYAARWRHADVEQLRTALECADVVMRRLTGDGAAVLARRRA